MRLGTSLEQVLQDARYGFCMLRRNPGFTTAAVLTLGLGIGATTTIFSVVDAVLLQPADVAPANFLDWREQAQSYDHMASVEPWSFDFTGGEQPEVFLVSLVSEGFFEALGITAVNGRTFLPEEFEHGSRTVVVLTDGMWRRRFGADPTLIGRSLTFDARPYTVVGVLPWTSSSVWPVVKARCLHPRSLPNMSLVSRTGTGAG